MEFFKKNYGLVLFLLFCLGVLIYELTGILDVQKRREENQKVRQEHLDTLAEIRNSHIRIDGENYAKAQEMAEKAKQAYMSFAKHLWEKRLLPGVDFSDEALEAAGSGTAQPQLDEENKPQEDPYRNLPNRLRFDQWTTGTLIDAREKLLNELNTLNRKAFKTSAIVDANQAGVAGLGGRAPGLQPSKAPVAPSKDASEQRLAKIVKGPAIPQYFMFGEYVLNRENGLKKLERHKVFRQFLLLEYLIKLLRNAEVDSLDAIDFPCGLEVQDGDKYTSIPVTLSVTGKPECVESLLNLLNADEHYIFYLQDITSFDGTVQLNGDSALPFNRNGGSRLQSYLNSVGTSADTVMSGGMETGAAGAETMASPEVQNPVSTGMGDGMRSEDGRQLQAMPLVRTRKAYRVFAKNQEEDRSLGMDGLIIERRQSNASEYGTRVSLSINFEYVEFKPVSE